MEKEVWCQGVAFGLTTKFFLKVSLVKKQARTWEKD